MSGAVRVLVLGATGMLGHKVCEVLGGTPDLDVHATARANAVPVTAGVELHPAVDVSTSTRDLGPLLQRLAPDVVVNAVGAVKQKDLRAAIDETFFVNGVLPHAIAQLNPNREGRVVHVSTDCVFAGDRGGYRESERPDALDLYGRSKAIGEIDYGPHVTLRTSIVGFERRGFLGLLSWFASHPPGAVVGGYTGAIYSGLPTVTLAATIRDLLVWPRCPPGLYHVASEPISKYELLARMNEALGLGICIEPDDSLRIDRSLDDTRFRAATGTKRPDWNTLVAELTHDYLTGNYDAIYRSRRDARPDGPCVR